jgi:membrane-associated phospholipid phosphatase
MRESGWPDFWKRRWSRQDVLGLHLTLGLLACMALIGLFGLVGYAIGRPGRIASFDQDFGQRLCDHRQESPSVRQLFLWITEAGSEQKLTVLTLGLAVVLLFRRLRLLALVWLVEMAGGGLLDSELKLFYQRDRPLFRDDAILETTMSFPSGHSMGAVLAYGFIAYLLFLVVRRLWGRLIVLLASILVIVAIGFSRLYLGAHFFSDVMGGYIIGLAWLTTCIAAYETARRHAGKGARG